MLRRPYTLDTVATAPVSSRDTSITLANSAGLTLLAGDWTYLKLEEYGKLEIVKAILKDGDKVYLVRAQDNTKAENFAAPTVSYTLTAQEIEDSLAQIYTLTLSGTGAAIVIGSNVEVARTTIEYDGVHYSFGSNNDIVIGRLENAYGCCPKDNEVAALGMKLFYLYAVTSKPYTQYDDGAYSITPQFAGASLRYTLVQHEQPSEQFVITPSFFSAATKNTLLDYTSPPESIALTPLFSGASTRAILLQYEHPPEAQLTLVPAFVSANTKQTLVLNTIPTESISIIPMFAGASTA